MGSTPPYSRVREASGLLFLAGIIGRDHDGLADGIDGQLALAFGNLSGLVESHGADVADVVRLVVYLTDLDAMGLLDARFVATFDEPRPARTTVQVAGLPGGALVELEATVAAHG